MKIKLTITILALSTLLTGCCISHDFTVASCTQPQTCIKCGETEGEPLGHTWVEATCTEPKQCSACNLTEGEPLGHTLSEATCTEASKCEVCNIVEGEPHGHNFKEADYENPKTCMVCGLTEGEPLEYQGDNPYDKEVDNYEGMTSQEIAQQIINDYLKEHAQENQIHVDIPGATKGDPSKAGSAGIDYSAPSDPALAGNYIN